MKNQKQTFGIQYRHTSQTVKVSTHFHDRHREMMKNEVFTEKQPFVLPFSIENYNFIISYSRCEIDVIGSEQILSENEFF